MTEITNFYGDKLPQLPPIRENEVAHVAINNIQHLFYNAVIRLPENEGITEAQARAYCTNNGLVLYDWLKSSKVIGKLSREKFPVMVKVFDSKVKKSAYTKYEGVHMGAFQIFRYERGTHRIIKDNSDEFLQTLFPTLEELQEVDKWFKVLLYSYHSGELPVWTTKDCVGSPADNTVIGIEPEVEMRSEAVIMQQGVPLNKMGRIITMCSMFAKQDPLLTLDCTVDLEFYIRPYGSLNGFRDNYLLLNKLFLISMACGTHCHISIVDDNGNVKWTNQKILFEAAKILFESFEFTFTNIDGNEITVVGFNEYLKLYPAYVEKIFGRMWGYWCGCYVGEGDHGSGVNITNCHVEVRLPQIHNEAQMIKVCEIIRAIAKAIDQMYEALMTDWQALFPDKKTAAKKEQAAKRRAFKSVVTVWNNAMNDKLASDTNSTKKPGSRRRNID